MKLEYQSPQKPGHDHQDCRHLLESLSGYIDGELEQALCAEIERHLEDCEDCRVVIDTLGKTVFLYHQTAEPVAPDIPEDVKERLFKRLDLEDFLDPTR
ncbi:MAG: zf-HC2 domain-containing protein [Anaerolineales bacterium]|nr:zf-HC2 domain-containing protein [Anaerolineales bacterium]